MAAFDEKKTRLNGMLAQRGSEPAAVGKSSNVPTDADSNASEVESDVDVTPQDAEQGGLEEAQQAAAPRDLGDQQDQAAPPGGAAAKKAASPVDDSTAETPTGAANLTAGMPGTGAKPLVPAAFHAPAAIQAAIDAATAGGGTAAAIKGAIGAAAAGAATATAPAPAVAAITGAKPPAAPTNTPSAPATPSATKMEGGDGAQTATPATAKPAGGGGAAGKITGAGASPKVNDAISNVAIGEKVTYSNTEDGSWFMDGDQIGSGTQIEWTAPNTPSMRNLRFEPLLSAPGAKKGTSKPIAIRAPSKVTFEKLGDLPAAGPDNAGVGMRLKVKVESADVAFGKVEWLERPGAAEGVSGYFAAYGAGRLNHVPAAGGIPMGATNDDVIDAAFSRDKPKLPHPDGTKRWWAGSFSWTVPNAYRIGGTETVFDTVQQSFSMTDDGTMTVTKGGMSATHKPASVTDGKDVVKFKDVNEAKVYLNPHGVHGVIAAALNYKRQPNADQASIGLLGQALSAYDIKLKTNLTCRTTHDWTGADRVTLTANGVSGSPAAHSINNGEKKTYTFSMNSIVNLKTLDTPSINLAASDKPMSATLGYPYDGLGGAMGDRYSYDSWFAWE